MERNAKAILQYDEGQLERILEIANDDCQTVEDLFDGARLQLNIAGLQFTISLLAA